MLWPVSTSVFLSLSAAVAAAAPDGEATIRGGGPKPIVIRTTARLAGAIHSLTWNGREFIDSFDHGRQLQSASNLDCGTPIKAETFNPTEAGSARDGAGPHSTSRLLFLRREPAALQTVTQMAFWLAPNERSSGEPAKNTRTLSDHLLTKRVAIGFEDLPQVLAYDVCFGLPIGERHRHAVFEALTGYMPAEFSDFWQFDPTSQRLALLSDGPGEIAHPVVLSTPSGAHAMGIYAPPQRRPRTTGPTYGRFRFTPEKVVKWNCVFRYQDAAGVPAAEYPFRMFVAVGTRDDVARSIAALRQRFVPADAPPAKP